MPEQMKISVVVPVRERLIVLVRIIAVQKAALVGSLNWLLKDGSRKRAANLLEARNGT